MKPAIAMCGLTCSECEAYRATQTNDEAWKERVAAKWREEFHAPGITAAYVTCDGCLAFGQRNCGHCSECHIRACGVTKGVENCAHCADYATCQKINDFLAMVPPARATLDGIRRTL